MPVYEPNEVQTLNFTNEDGKTFELKGDFLTNVTIPETATTTKITSATTTSGGTISIGSDWFYTTTTTTFTIPLYNEMDKVKEECKKYMNKVDEHVDKLEEDIEFINNERLSHKDLIDDLLCTIHDHHTEIDTLKKELEGMRGYINWLEQKINELGGPKND